MHYTNTAKLVQAGVAAIPRLPQQDQGRATAWLLGFAAHITTDMTIHPVVEAAGRAVQGQRVRVSPLRDASGRFHLPAEW